MRNLTLTPEEEILYENQPIRLVDIFLLGPLMAWMGVETYREASKREKGKRTMGGAMAIMGLLTVVHNGRNYMRVEELRRGRHQAR